MLVEDAAFAGAGEDVVDAVAAVAFVLVVRVVFAVAQAAYEVYWVAWEGGQGVLGEVVLRLGWREEGERGYRLLLGVCVSRGGSRSCRYLHSLS